MKQQKIKTKELVESADSVIAAGVKNREALNAALPLLVAMQERAQALKGVCATLVKASTMLSELCANYVDGHESVFGDTLREAPNGVVSGNVECGDEVFHYVRGFDGFKRNEDGKQMSQEFLQGLPEGWTETKLALAIGKEQDISPEELDAAGLMRKPKRVWSKCVEGGCDDEAL